MSLFKRYYPVLVAVLVAVLPLGMNTYWTEVAVNVGLYALLALSLNVILGQAGIFHMGHAAFYAVGAYVTAILNTHYQIPILLLIPVAGAAAALFALIVARPIIHLRGDYLLIVTIGIVEIVRIALINDVFGLTGGANGIFGIARPELFGIKIRKAIQFLLASNLAGIAFNAAGLGICHSLAHALGGRFHLPHGRLNALILPHVIHFNAADGTAAEKYGRLARLCGLAANPRSLAAGLNRLRAQLKLPERLSACGVEGKELTAALDGLAEAAQADLCAPSNPRPAAAEDLKSLLRELA